MHEALQTRWGQAEKRARVGEWLYSRVLQVNASIPSTPRADENGRNCPGDTGAAAAARECAPSADTVPPTLPSTPTSFPRSWFANIAQGGFNVLWQMGLTGKPAAPTIAAEWQSGLVDVHFLNNCGAGEAPALLYRRRTTSPDDPMEVTGVEIAPGKSVRLVSHEREAWEARVPGSGGGGGGRGNGGAGDGGSTHSRQDGVIVIGRWEIDRANGVVQHAVLCGSADRD